MDLVEFLRARLDEDERIARAASGRPERPSPSWGWHEDGYVAFYPDEAEPFLYSVERPARAEHVARHDPARVLREVEAKRRLVEWIVGLEDKALGGEWWNLDYMLALQLLALPYADHEAYRPEWRP